MQKPRVFSSTLPASRVLARLCNHNSQAVPGRGLAGAVPAMPVAVLTITCSSEAVDGA